MHYRSKDYVNRVYDILLSEQPELLKDLKKTHVRTVLSYFVRNISTVCLYKRAIRLKRYFKLMPDASDIIFKTRYGLSKRTTKGF